MLGHLEVHAAEITRLELDSQVVPPAQRGKRSRRRSPRSQERRDDILIDLLLDHVEDQRSAVGSVQNLLPVAIDSLALLVHHFVVFEQVLADLEVAFFDLLLGRLDAPRDHAGFRSASPSCMPSRSRMLLRPTAPAKIRIRSSSQRQVEATAAGIALASAATAQLQVDPPRFVPFGADHVQPAELA